MPTTPVRIRAPSLLLLTLLLLACAPQQSELEPDRIRIAIVVDPLSSALLVAEHERAFAEQGLEVEWLHCSNGHACLEALQQGRADFATAASVPVVHSIAAGEHPIIYASIARMHDFLVVAARRSTGIETLDDLPGHRIAAIAKTNTVFFLDNLIHLNDLDPSTIEQVPASADTIASLMAEGNIDAAAVWPRIAYQLQDRFGDDIVMLHEREAYFGSWNLVGMATAEREQAQERARRILRAIIPYDRERIADDPDHIEEVARRCGLTVEEQRRIMQTIWFEPRLDQSLLLQLEDQLDWTGHQARVLMLDHLDPGPIDDLDPLRSTLIR